MTTDPVAAGARQLVRRTDLYLRLGMVLLVLLLAAAITLERLRYGSLLDSVSAYYYTPAHAVFIACLCSLGACMIIYPGRSGFEDVTLNAAGFLAFLVAFVPTSRGEAECDPSRAFCDIPTSTIAANVAAVLLVGGVGLLVAYLAPIMGAGKGVLSHVGDRHARIALHVLAVGYVFLVAVFFLDRATFLRMGHGWSALVLFAGLIIVIVNSGLHLGHRGSRRVWYWGSLALALLAMAIVWFAGRRGAMEHWIFVEESIVIGGFTFFWVTQKVAEVWAEPAAPEPTEPTGPTEPPEPPERVLA
ncbi:hypothetical protein SAMN05421678_10479 [Actinopolymorpha cephalotaxi]|uniref:DUF998 domain-containing protein n=1 Tax=Actinopolymorpha cephalotaxi TaxID=504797 RepID=A0A1I2PIZ2_9ACTN|nr:hypothetical protein [Actinopolymorpha cephalotaxi]NYH83669.1 hypothetical protein [Actinopolymorpha cephalotaxi]SFG13616.1 hypothetical protein SAMN05421678_10479 [Actinopolymorpha cephalotaxi]